MEKQECFDSLRPQMVVLPDELMNQFHEVVVFLIKIIDFFFLWTAAYFLMLCKAKGVL